MTFKHSAFVKITDSEKKEEVIKFLESIGYEIDEEVFWYKNICTNDEYVFGTSLDYEYGTIDCGDNIDLFKAIVAINDDNDYMQYYIAKENYYWDLGTYYEKGEIVIKEEIPLFVFYSFEKATPEQLIDYFKNIDIEKIHTDELIMQVGGELLAHKGNVIKDFKITEVSVVNKNKY